MVRKLIKVFGWVMLPVLSVGGGSQMTFAPVVDNLIMENSTNSSTANTVYATSENCVGMQHSYGVFYNYVASASLIYFDLSSLVGKTVLEASLYLYPAILVGDSAGAAARTDYKVSAVTEVWSGSTVTWNNAPPTTSLYEKVFEVPITAAIPTIIEVTDIVKYWMDGTWTNYGFMVLDVDYQAYFCNCLDATCFGALGSPSDKVPKLVVSIAEDAPIPPERFLPPIMNYILD